MGGGTFTGGKRGGAGGGSEYTIPAGGGPDSGSLGGGGSEGGGAVYTGGYGAAIPGYAGYVYLIGSIFGGSNLTSAPFFMGVSAGLETTTATGDAEVGGVMERGFLSFFGCLAAEGGGGESPPDECG